MVFSLGKYFFQKSKYFLSSVITHHGAPKLGRMTSFSDVKKAKTAYLISVIYKLIYLQFKIREIFPSRLANHINKLVLPQSFFYLIGNISRILN